MLARGVGTLLAVFLLVAFLPKILSKLVEGSHVFPQGREWEGQAMLAMFLIYLIGYAISWWRPLWGGIFICLSAAAVSAPFIIIDGHYNSLMFGVPLFIVGVFYLLLHSLESREKRRQLQSGGQGA